MKILIFILLLFFVSVQAQPPGVNAARTFRQAHEHEIMEEFTKLLAIPNVASDTANIRRNADLISEMLAARGVKTQLLTVPDVAPSIASSPCSRPLKDWNSA